MNILRILSAVLALVTICGCQNIHTVTQVFWSPVGQETLAAVCVLQGTEGSSVKGFVEFHKVKNDIKVIAKVSGLTPGKHGFHIHHIGDIRSSDASACAGHFDPTNQSHGGPKSSKRHIGDLGNLEANAEGVAELEFLDPLLKLYGPNSIIGRSVVIDANQDSFKKNAMEDSGSRVAQGVIGILKVKERKEVEPQS